MLIGVRKRFVFVANTKTASTAIEQVLAEHAEIMRGGGPARKHIGMRDILREYNFLFGRSKHAPETYFVFGVMREPLDWIGSWFRYRKGNQVENPLPAEMSFAQFWARNDWNITRRDGRANLQSDRFTAADGTVLADVVIPYHELDSYLGEICAVLNIKAPMPKRNVSRIREIGEEIPPELLDAMRAHYAEDYALFEQLDEINAAGMEKLRMRSRKTKDPARKTAPKAS